ncbi:hypothetical protein QBC47DRAFT_399060 [Echria macrotheca]|uniref:Uncharacterized protein n=1 Tax=Echria macrotheca TaxID=438768 RepID=A0AAJ0FDZ2_9PEZI|nr:hypothetical protein QBC47DRAFT_399060 [Echria macrotheca]
MTGVALGGCTSINPGTPEIFVVQLGLPQYSSSLRVGYFGVCAVHNVSDTKICFPTSSSTSSDILANQLFSLDSIQIPSVEGNDKRKAVVDALSIQSRIFPCIEAAAAAAFMFGLIHFALLAFIIRKEKLEYGHDNDPSLLRKRRTARSVLRYLWLITLGLALILACIAATTTMQAAAAMEFASTNFGADTPVEAGLTLQALQWAACLSMLTFMLTSFLWAWWDRPEHRKKRRLVISRPLMDPSTDFMCDRQSGFIIPPPPVQYAPPPPRPRRTWTPASNSGSSSRRARRARKTSPTSTVGPTYAPSPPVSEMGYEPDGKQQVHRPVSPVSEDGGVSVHQTASESTAPRHQPAPGPPMPGFF